MPAREYVEAFENLSAAKILRFYFRSGYIYEIKFFHAERFLFQYMQPRPKVEFIATVFVKKLSSVVEHD